MEHIYSRDIQPVAGANGLKTKTLLAQKPLQCPSCFVPKKDEIVENIDLQDEKIPSNNEIIANDSMNESLNVANSVDNKNPEEQNWEENIKRDGWKPNQQKLFKKAARILDLDQLARLAHQGRKDEAVHRRLVIDKSANRMRRALASVAWESRCIQWLHCLLMDKLPPIYMASYLDILQTLKSKIPSLMDKMLFGRPMNVKQELLAPVLKTRWEPIVPMKDRRLSSVPVILIVPLVPSIGRPSTRIQKWLQQFSKISQVVQVTVQSAVKNSICKQSFTHVAEYLVSLTRNKIKELRNEQTESRPIVLVGFGGGSFLALQVALLEKVSCVVCMGFAFNTINGVRGGPDDNILEITTPILFVIGQNAAKTSQEEMEGLREKMQSETMLVVVGSADDNLRIPTAKKQNEVLTQSMVDDNIMGEVFGFVESCITNPPGPREPYSTLAQIRKIAAAASANASAFSTQHSYNQNIGQEIRMKKKVGRPRKHPLPEPQFPALSAGALNQAVQSILPPISPPLKKSKIENYNQIPTYPFRPSTMTGRRSERIQKYCVTGNTPPSDINKTPLNLRGVEFYPPQMGQNGTNQMLKNSPFVLPSNLHFFKSTPNIPNSFVTNALNVPFIYADGNLNFTTNAPVTSTEITPKSAQSNQTAATSTFTPKPIENPGTSEGDKKYVYINRNTLKPYPNILSRSAPPSKYKKVIVTNPKRSATVNLPVNLTMPPTERKTNMGKIIVPRREYPNSYVNPVFRSAPPENNFVSWNVLKRAAQNLEPLRPVEVTANSPQKQEPKTFTILKPIVRYPTECYQQPQNEGKEKYFQTL